MFYMVSVASSSVMCVGHAIPDQYEWVCHMYSSDNLPTAYTTV